MIPPELNATMLFVIVGFPNTAQPIPSPLLPVIVLFVMVDSEQSLYIPPPHSALFPAMVLFVIVGHEKWQHMPPPDSALFPVMALFVIVGDESSQ